MLDFNEIPQAIIDEINEHYTLDDSEYGSEITSQTVSRRLNYRITEQTSDTVTGINPETFEPQVYENATFVTAFTARGDIEGETFKLRQLLSSGRVLTTL